jgi:dCTP diphosphatase
MTDDSTTLADLKQRMAAFVAAREWQKYHRPKNLAMSLAIEAAELMEHFQWLTPEEADAALADPATREQVGDEMSDVLAFLLSLANCTGIDLAAAFEAKMLKNEQKYPPDLVRGNYRRPEGR